MHDGTNFPVPERTGIPGDCATLFVSLELSRSTWVATSLAPGSKKMSKHTLAGGNGRELLDLLARLKTRAEQRIAAPVKVVAIHEVGLDGFWIHRLLEANGVESHVVDPASIAVPRRHRRTKTEAIDGETLRRTLMAWQRGEPRVCAMTVPPSPSEEDCRRVSRERATLLRERIRHTNRIRGLLFGQGITNYNPLHKNRRECLEELRTGDGRSLPTHVKAEILREIDRLELVLRQISEVEAERDEMLRPAEASSPAALLMRLKGIGPRGKSGEGWLPVHEEGRKDSRAATQWGATANAGRPLRARSCSPHHMGGHSCAIRRVHCAGRSLAHYHPPVPETGPHRVCPGWNHP